MSLFELSALHPSRVTYALTRLQSLDTQMMPLEDVMMRNSAIAALQSLTECQSKDITRTERLLCAMLSSERFNFVEPNVDQSHARQIVAFVRAIEKELDNPS